MSMIIDPFRFGTAKTNRCKTEGIVGIAGGLDDLTFNIDDDFSSNIYVEQVHVLSNNKMLILGTDPFQYYTWPDPDEKNYPGTPYLQQIDTETGERVSSFYGSDAELLFRKPLSNGSLSKTIIKIIPTKDGNYFYVVYLVNEFVNYVQTTKVERFFSDGSLDSSFNADASGIYPYSTWDVDYQGRIFCVEKNFLASGYNYSAPYTERVQIFRFNLDGTKDFAFNNSANSSYNSLFPGGTSASSNGGIQGYQYDFIPDHYGGFIVFCGAAGQYSSNFTANQYGIIQSRNMLRLTSAGTYDLTFDGLFYDKITNSTGDTIVYRGYTPTRVYNVRSDGKIVINSAQSKYDYYNSSATTNGAKTLRVLNSTGTDDLGYSATPFPETISTGSEYVGTYGSDGFLLSPNEFFFKGKTPGYANVVVSAYVLDFSSVSFSSVLSNGPKGTDYWGNQSWQFTGAVRDSGGSLWLYSTDYFSMLSHQDNTVLRLMRVTESGDYNSPRVVSTGLYSGSPLSGLKSYFYYGSESWGPSYGVVADIAIYSNQKILLAGQIDSVQGKASQNSGKPFNGIVRLNSDGSLDNSFGVKHPTNQNLLFDLSPLSYSSNAKIIALDKDNGIIVSGAYWVNAISKWEYEYKYSGIFRLLPDGTLDTSFTQYDFYGSLVTPENVGWYSPGQYGADSLTVQDDGKIVISGDFSLWSGETRLGLGVVRFNPDWSVDGSLYIDPAWELTYFDSIVESDGKILVLTNLGLVRLNIDGSIDQSFSDNELSTTASYYTSFVQRCDDSYLVNCVVSSQRKIVKLNNDGSIDNSYVSPVYRTNSYGGPSPSKLIYLPDNTCIVLSEFPPYNDYSPDYRQDMQYVHVSRLLSNGELDTDWDYTKWFNAPPLAAAIQDDGWLVVGGPFSRYNGRDRGGVARIGGGIMQWGQ